MDIPLNNSTALRNEMFKGWMRSPGTRSTADVLWTCLATIFLCVYTAVHLNMPEPGEPERWQVIRRVKWVVIAILAPEIVLQCAWSQYLDAKYVQNSLKEILKQGSNQDRGPSSAVTDSLHEPHTAGADIPLQTSKQHHIHSSEDVFEAPDAESITLTYAFYAIMGGLRVRTGPDQRSHCIGPKAVLDLAKAGIFWNVSTTSIMDKSKADNLAKFLTVVQVLWMLVQCIARMALNLPLTLLEVHTFIHAVCAFMMFLLWFKKPLNVRDATIRTVSPENPALRELLVELPSDSEHWPDLVARRVNVGRGWRNGKPDSRSYDLGVTLASILGGGSSGYFETQDSAVWINMAGITFVQIIYGALHAAAWHTLFPSAFEQWAWRASCVSIATTGVALVLFIFGYLWMIADRFGDFLDGVLEYVALAIIVIIGIVWTVTRAFIVVEAIIAIRAVPIGVYAIVPWSTYFPHI